MPHGRVAVALVSHEPGGPTPRSAAPATPHAPLGEECLYVAGLVALPAREDKCERLAIPLGAHVDLCRETTARASECLPHLTTVRTGRVEPRPLGIG